MMKLKNTVQKIVALVLVMALMVFNMPTNTLFASDDTTDGEELIRVDIIVTGADGEDILDAEFSVNGQNTIEQIVQQKRQEVTTEETTSDETSTEETTTEENSTEETSSSDEGETEEAPEETTTEALDSLSEEVDYTNRYTLEIKKHSDESDICITVNEKDHREHTATVEYQEDTSSYEVRLVRYADLENDDIAFSKGVYSCDIDYNDSNEYIFSLSDEAECKVDGSSENVTVSDMGDSKQWKVTYSEPGTIEVVITPKSDSDTQFETTRFQLTVKNDLKFEYSKNNDIANGKVEADSSNNLLVGKVTKTVSEADESMRLNLTSSYEGTVEYESSKVGVAEVITKGDDAGKVILKGCGTTVITATCSKSKVSASYILIVEAADTALKMYEDVNGDGIKGEDEREILDKQTIKVDVLEAMGDEIRIVGMVDDAKRYTMEYKLDGDSTVATVSDSGAVTITGVGKVSIIVTAKSNVFYRKDKSVSYTIEVNESDIYASLLNTKLGTEIEEGDTILLYDTLDNRDITVDSATGEEVLILPLDIQLYNSKNDERVNLSDDINIELKSGELQFDGYTIINQDDIVRNEKFTVEITVSDKNGRFEPISISVDVMLEGNRTNNMDESGNPYYKVEGLHDGFDGNLWKDTDKVVVVTGNTVGGHLYLVGEDGRTSHANPTYEVPYGESEPYYKEHKIFVLIRDDFFEPTRLFFGVDSSVPTCTVGEDITYSGTNINETSYGICSDGSVTVTVKANDTEGNLYNATFYADGKELATVSPAEGDGYNGKFTYTFDKNTHAGLNDNLTVIIRDVAKNESEIYELEDIIIESTNPDAFITFSSGNDADMYKSTDGRQYVSKDVSLDILVSDLIGTTDAGEVSGLASYEVYINGVKNSSLSKTFPSNGAKVASDSFVLNTADYGKDSDGKLTVEVRNVKDMVGNEGVGKTFTIYIDSKAPTVTYNSVQTSGKENITSYGNFYNRDITLVFNVTDNMTGIKSATLVVGSREIEGYVVNNKVSFKVPIGVSGQASLKIVDNVNHQTTIKLSDVRNVKNEKVFTSDYILVENVVAGKPTFTVSNTDKGRWYRSQVDVDIAISDEASSIVSSGLASVKIYINDKEYTAKTYSNKDTIKDTFKVSVNNQWIDAAINDAGSYTIKVVIVDNAGNEISYIETVYIDTVAPVISDLTGVVNGSVNTGTVTVNVELFEKHYAEKGNSTVVMVKRTLDGETTVYEADKFVYTSAETSKPYTFTADGAYEIVVTSEDAAGNVAQQKTTSFVIDNTAPLADITGVTPNGYYTDSADVTIDVIESNFKDMKVLIGIAVELNGEVRTIDNVLFDGTQKHSSITRTFAEEGKYVIKVDAIDAAGNLALTKTVAFTIDTSAPVINISGIKDGTAYKDDVIPVITINDNYYKNYSISLVKTGVYFNDDLSNVSSISDMDVTDKFMSALSSEKNGAKGTFDTFEKIQSNDGVYTLTVTATDYAGRVSEETIHFSINRFGSVYTFDSNLKNIINTYNTSVDKDLKITEYNADRLVSDSVNIRITRDGATLDEVIVEKSAIGDDNVRGDSGWYQYEYLISKDNFVHDGVYVVTVSSADEAGNSSENITYDELSIRFAVDTTKPEITKIVGLSDTTYNAVEKNVDYQVFDAVGLKEVKIYIDDKCVQTVNEFADVTTYSGSFTVGEGVQQHVRFVIEDLAGNIIDSDNSEDMKLGKIVQFNDVVTVSTNAFVRWYANKPLFYGSIAAAGSVVAGGSTVFVLRRKRLKTKK